MIDGVKPLIDGVKPRDQVSQPGMQGVQEDRITATMVWWCLLLLLLLMLWLWRVPLQRTVP